MLFTKESNICIVVPVNATDREQFAATELRTYLNKIFALTASIKMANEAPAGDKIVLGCPRRNALTANYISAEEFDKIVPGPEGYLIKSFGDAIVIAGSSTHPNELERGTIYGVYEFLERFLGCSLAVYIKDGVPGGEYVPTYESLELKDICHSQAKAALASRTACAQYSSHGKGRDMVLNFTFLDWLCKNRYNQISTWNVVYESFKTNGMLEEMKKRGLIMAVSQHDAFDTLLPQHGNKYFPEHYYETHPEYYKLNADGTRFENQRHWGQLTLCCRNDEMIEEMSKNLIEWLNLNPIVKNFGLVPKDGVAPQCCCEKCKPYTKTENYVHLVNSIAKRVAKVHPDTTLNFSAYADLWAPPVNAVLEPNVIVGEATWYRDETWTPELAKVKPFNSSGLRTTGKPDGTCLTGTFFEDNLLAWHALGAEVRYYDYFMGVYPARQRYIPMADEMQAICKRFVEKGIKGLTTQIEVYNMWNHVFNFYTYGRTAYNTELSMEDNLENFCKIFGKGAPYIAENIRYAESVLDGQADIMFAGIYLMQNIDKARMYDGFEKALAAADTPASRNNIRMMRMEFRYSDLECREDYSMDEMGYKQLKVFTTPERGELFYMRDNFDTYTSCDGYGIMIPVDGEPAPFEPDYWYMFE